MSDLIFRCSSLHRLMGNAKSIDDSLINNYVLFAKSHADKLKKRKVLEDYELDFLKLFESEYKKLQDSSLSVGAKSLVKEMVRKVKHKAPSKFSGSRETRKGHLVEEDAIKFLMQQEFISVEKNDIRFTNSWITGEPDVITKDCVKDTKCPFSYWSMEYFADDIESKSLDAGYDWQQLGYLWLLRENNDYAPVFIDNAELKYVLMPTPSECLGKNDDEYLHVDYVLEMNPRDRITTYPIKYDQSKIELIKIKIEAARNYAKTLELK
jgi:hypothetical protein